MRHLYHLYSKLFHVHSYSTICTICYLPAHFIATHTYMHTDYSVLFCQNTLDIHKFYIQLDTFLDHPARVIKLAIIPENLHKMKL